MAKKTTLKEIGEMLTHVVAHMATKDDAAALRKELKGDIAGLRKELKGDIAGVSEQVTSIEHELKAIRRDLADLRERFENVSGFHKEIDHALERIAAIEKHLGLDKKIAA
jgi:septal ring factor EnvC (AmiA/AmiB activator)